MEHLRVDPEVLLKRITLQIEDYKYTCFDTMRDYLDISIFKLVTFATPPKFKIVTGNLILF